MKTKFDPANSRPVYLNNYGTRAVRIDSWGHRETLPFSTDGGKTIVQRAVCYWEQCGNFAFPTIKVKGKRQAVYPDSDVEVKFYSTYSDKYGARKI